MSQFLANESPWKIMKNAFLFLRYSNFCPGFFAYVEKRFDMKAKVTFEIYDVFYWEANSYNPSRHTTSFQRLQDVSTTSATSYRRWNDVVCLLGYELSNIIRSDIIKTMKFGQLIEYNRKSIFLEKSYTKCIGETSPKPFSKKLKLTISLDQQSEILQFAFIVCPCEDC